MIGQTIAGHWQSPIGHFVSSLALFVVIHLISPGIRLFPSFQASLVSAYLPFLFSSHPSIYIYTSSLLLLDIPFYLLFRYRYTFFLFLSSNSSCSTFIPWTSR
ncbi:hypothetical protein C8J56DRAFT_931395 [Mycena floridula]|nr:hypothetical protein C8J56DRAFT_931395 [Mycena floridula]